LRSREEVKLLLLVGVKLEVVRHAGCGILDVVDHCGCVIRVGSVDKIYKRLSLPQSA
jgi:hypothetical protein